MKKSQGSMRGQDACREDKKHKETKKGQEVGRKERKNERRQETS